MSKIKVLKHGLRVDGKYIPCRYDIGTMRDKATISIYARDYGHQLPEELKPENDTDMMTDYFEKDRARINPDHPLYTDLYRYAMEKRLKWDAIEEQRQREWKARQEAAIAMSMQRIPARPSNVIQFPR